ncbi:hypothetical protein N7490_009394 [Penicillium lividum]|nr:hypothetical protein N7490_009394 [Penicillium lividum]
MAPLHSFNILSLVFTAFLPSVLAKPWIVTEAYEEVRVTGYAYDEYQESYVPTVTTSIEEIRPTESPLPEAVSTITSVDELSSVTIIQQLYPTNVGTPVPYYYDYYNYYTDDTDHTTVYVVNITYSAATACSTQWTTTAAVTVYPPDAIANLLPTTAMSTSLSVDNSRPFEPTTYTVDYIWIEPTQIPSSSLSYLSTEYAPSTQYDDSCYYSTGNSYCEYCNYDDYEGNWFFDPWYLGGGISPFALTMIILFGWIGVWLIAGFIEAWVRFRRLCLGWQTRRGIPLCWAFTVLPISLLLIIGFRKGFRSRSETDAVELRKQWDSLGFWKKLKLFFVWGFRFKYPPILGEAPPRVKASKQPGQKGVKQPRESLLGPEPMATGAAQPRGVSENTDPEMGEVENNSRSSGQDDQPASGALNEHHAEIGRAE